MFDKPCELVNIQRPMHDSWLTQPLKQRALDLGFDLVGIAPVGPISQADALLSLIHISEPTRPY